MRTALAALAFAVLGAGAPARAATPLALADRDASIALAGDTALFGRDAADELHVLAVPVDGSARAATRLRIPVSAIAGNDIAVSGSAQRAAVVVIGADQLDVPFSQAFSGPPAGPWAPLAPLVALDTDAFFPAFPRVDGDRLFMAELRGGSEAYRYVLREGDAAPVELALPPVPASFAGDLAAYVDPADDRRLVVRDWRTGAERAVVLADSIDTLDVRADGATVVGEDDGGVLAISPAGAVTRLSKTGKRPQFAGERVVYVDGDRLMAVDPGAAPRPVGVPSATLGSFDADERHVLWTGNGCLLAADLAAPAATAPARGACPRSELALEDDGYQPTLRRDRTITLHLRCVAAPRACRGRVRVSFYSPAHGRSDTVRFTIAAGRRKHVVVRFPRAAYASARRAARRTDAGTVTVDVPAVTRDPDGRRNILSDGYIVTVG